MGTEYVQHRDGNIYVGPSRVTIDSVVISWRNGRTPEQIHESFPSVPLANIYGAIAYYLEHRDEIDEWIRDGEEIYERERLADQAARPEWSAMMRARFGEARKRMGMSDDGERDADVVEESPSAPTPAASNE